MIDYNADNIIIYHVRIMTRYLTMSCNYILCVNLMFNMSCPQPSCSHFQFNELGLSNFRLMFNVTVLLCNMLT